MIQGKDKEKHVSISCILPIYNVSCYLKDTLQSLQSQTLRDIEIICVNDNSDDDSLDVLIDIQKRDERIIVINLETHRGAAACRNTGLKQARGEFVIFLDADDFFYNNMLDTAYILAKDHNADLVVFGFEKAIVCMDANDNEKISDVIITNSKNEIIEHKSIDNSFFRKVGMVPWNKLVKKKLINDCGILFQNIPSNNDIYYSFAVAVSAKKIVISDMVLLRYFFGRKNSLTQSRMEKKNYFVAAYSKTYQYLKNKNFSAPFLKVFTNYILDNLQLFFESKDYSDVAKNDSYYQLIQDKSVMKEIMLCYANGSLFKHNYNFADKILKGENVINCPLYYYYIDGIKALLQEAELNNETVALWGFGYYGRRFVDMLNETNLKIDYIIDMDPQKQSMRYGSYQICDYFSVMNDIDIVWVLNSKIYSEVKEIIKNKKIVDINKL